MSAASPPPADSTPDVASTRPAKSQRLLACVLCKQRKVKCDRKFPCANCIKSQAQCVPATLAPRRRRRQFPQRDLLDRVRHYEDLLRQHNIKFDPLHPGLLNQKESPNTEDGDDSDEDPTEGAGGSGPSSSPRIKSEEPQGAKNFWNAMRQGFLDPDDSSDNSQTDVREYFVKKAWDQAYRSDDFLHFASHDRTTDLSTLHPEPLQIFRLWQIYLDNVNPLLKVTHTPSLQGRLIDAASDTSNIDPPLEALMFSIYALAITSLDNTAPMLGPPPKDELLSRYLFGCRQALVKAGFLRSTDLNCLTALYLYLVTVGTRTDPRALSSTLGLTMRIAQRMRIDSEAANSKCNALEAEMRRRLWWGLVLFDSRMAELADFKTALLNPMWDCKIPLNVNDSDLRPEMKEPPAVLGPLSEAIFAVVRCELGEQVRNSAFHLEFTNPALIPMAKISQQASKSGRSELDAVEKMIEDKYFQACDPENPLHYMTMLTTRSSIAKFRLVESYSKFSDLSLRETETERDAASSCALKRLQMDTEIMSSPLTKGYRWFALYYFPFPSYVHLILEMKKRPLGDLSKRAWEAMSDNYEARNTFPHVNEAPFLSIFSKILFYAWDTCEAAAQRAGETWPVPRVVSYLRRQLADAAQSTVPTSAAPNVDMLDLGVDELLMPFPMGMDTQSLLYSMGGQNSGPAATPGLYPNTSTPPSMAVDVNSLQHWAAMGWGFGNPQAGGPAGPAG